ncbi:N-acyl-L-homoserine lactone synthetase [Desulfobacter hydrogenophilus]|uniref:N-acyl-L-homoserine lactone synthetase n=1 Tax=Desulfobacter hydrogenophilus TaxID=2291 RepID=A0A328FEG2_9BACT|nr:N-acyl-L-homoserine lactone synthetase [Desulfobacter hydrogenophilus]NDY72380.1 N-acyl-L-homoserine lactone synthetase [Desulfobacter hydrogenophilus]QBH13106.1 N-acyl-L-homoserine lactone synthetase [Desulfobacter hydrogenophilus]RAM01812.1 N-acyl-L-homoserine lactone synthetase [Desulfobacter hydrogenophilus]
MNLSSILLNSFVPYLPMNFRKRIIRGALPDFRTNLENVSFCEASSVEDYMSCFKLLHDVYVDAGFIQPSSIPLRIIPHHSDPESRVFMACLTDNQAENTPIYTASIFPDNEQGLPMDTGFKQQVDVLRNQDRRLVEVGCLASDPLYRKGNKNIPMLGNRMLVSYAINTIRADDLLITTHPKYLKIYEDILLFEKIGQIPSFSYVNNNPAVALRLNLKTARRRFKKVYAKKPKEKNLYHFFFESGATPIDLSSEGDKETKRYYGSDMIKRVLNKAYSFPWIPHIDDMVSLS